MCQVFSHFSVWFFLHHLVLAKLATSSIRVKHVLVKNIWFCVGPLGCLEHEHSNGNPHTTNATTRPGCEAGCEAGI